MLPEEEDEDGTADGMAVVIGGLALADDGFGEILG